MYIYLVVGRMDGWTDGHFEMSHLKRSGGSRWAWKNQISINCYTATPLLNRRTNGHLTDTQRNSHSTVTLER